MVLAEPPEVVITARPLANATGLKSRFYSNTVDGKQVRSFSRTPIPPCCASAPSQAVECRPWREKDRERLCAWVCVVVASAQVTVEELALEHYGGEAAGRWRGLHCEGGVWACLAGLLLWDCLFAEGVPDVFRTPFQTAPLDLETDAFYPTRRDMVRLPAH